jgi:hypothetical protein
VHAKQAEVGALAELFALPPLTVASMRAVIEYAVRLEDGGSDEVLSALGRTSLKSPLLV